jgi:hypothetical protein
LISTTSSRYKIEVRSTRLGDCPCSSPSRTSLIDQASPANIQSNEREVATERFHSCMTAADLQSVRPPFSLLAGDRSPEMGGGIAVVTYVIRESKAIGTFSVSEPDIRRRFVEI